jgi:DNA polymerase-3 subunit gamma/tau
MGQALYRKYRSKSLSEIVGQDHIISTLQNSLKKGSISHAYLFTGPRGVGKTSIARILAHEINGLDYNEDKPDIDIIEIDAASNRRIDEIRDLRDKVHIAPTSAKYKVYIIDEVHMLTKEAFNALLKTLEEPPAHVIFILATTESHKLPETIISRTQRFNFKSIDSVKAVEHLRSIANDENLKISDEALELIAEHGDGSFRDSIGLLDQISSLGRQVEAQDVRDMLGVAPKALIDELLKGTLSGTPKQILDSLALSSQRGYEPVQIAKQLSRAVRQQLVNGGPPALTLTQLMNQLIEVPASSNPAIKLEVVLLGVNLQQDSAPTIKPVAEVVKPQVPKTVDTKVEIPKAAVKQLQKVQPTDDFKQAWSNVLLAIKQKYNTLYGVLRMAEPTINEQVVTLGFQFPFHQKRINDPKTKQIVSDLLSAQLGNPVTITCKLDPAATPLETPAPDKQVTSSPLQTISNIFGAAEVLES